MQYKHLPHLDLIEYYQFITFRTADSTDGFLQRLALQNKLNSEIQMDVDKYLDDSMKGAYLNGNILRYLYSYFREKDRELYELVAFAVMPNHVHLLVKPLVKLSPMMQNIKGASAKAINEFREVKGKFWAKDYYDRAIRNEKHFLTVYQYVKNNPLKLGATKVALPRFYGIYED